MNIAERVFVDQLLCDTLSNSQTFIHNPVSYVEVSNHDLSDVDNSLDVNKTLHVLIKC